MPKKTISVEYVKSEINRLLSLDVLSQDRKESISLILEKLLHETGNYRGFRYLFDWNATPKDQAEAQRYNREYF